MLNFEDFSLNLSGMKAILPGGSSERIKVESLSQEIKQSKPNILIFGMDGDIRFLLKSILELWDYDTSEVSSVEQAIYAAENKIFDAVLMDIKFAFPDSLSEMRKMQKNDRLKNSPFILLSGHAQNDVRLSALAAGATNYFVKPVNLDLLEQTLKTHFADGKKSD